MLQPFTITVQRSDGSSVTYALTSHQVKPRNGKEQTIYHFVRVGGAALSPLTFTVIEGQHLEATDDQLASAALAMIDLLGYSAVDAANLMAGFWAEAARLSSQQAKDLQKRLRLRLQG